MLESLSYSEKQEYLKLCEDKRKITAKNSLSAYCRYIEIPGAPLNDLEDCEEFYPDNVVPAEHHELLLSALQKVAEGEIKNLMVFMPPGSAKSTYASVVFPTWFMGRFAGRSIIKVTYGSDLAKKFGRKCRAIVKSKHFDELFGCTLTGDNAAVDDWSLTNASTYMCGGILSGITGNRADGLIIDDPIKGREEADSETIRNKTWEAYADDVDTRLKPSGWRIIIQTRWHEDDLSGRILPEGYAGESGWVKSRTGADWYVICLQAECERDDDPLGRQKGEFLWTDWFPVEWWKQKKKDKTTPSARSWNALYQQRPAADEGDFFKREWIRWYDEKPQHLRIYGASDYAVTEGDGDWTVHLVIGVDPHNNIYLLDLWRGQADSLAWAEAFISMVLQWKPLEWAEEAGQINKSMKPILDRLQRERGAQCYRKAWPSMVDKAARAQSIRGMMALGQVFFPKSAAWVGEFISELMAFPAGKHDDQVDTFGLVGRMLSHLAAAQVPPEDKPPQYGPKTFNDLLNISKQRNRID